MKSIHDRAFKEWAIACEAMAEGRQILLIRKGGICEEGNTFTINDPEFFLMPTYEHQNASLLQPTYIPKLEVLQATPHDLNTVTLHAYAVVDTILVARDDEQVNAVASETIWNAIYVKQRFDFNPYDPLYLILLRVYNLPEPVTIPMRSAYEGCKSWITLERPISTAGATPAIPDAEFAHRRAAVIAELDR